MAAADVGLRRREAAQWSAPTPGAVRRRSRRLKRPRARTRPDPLRRGGLGRRGGLARVDDGVGRLWRSPGDDGRGGARRGVRTCPGDGFLAAGGARAGVAAMEGRSMERLDR